MDEQSANRPRFWRRLGFGLRPITAELAPEPIPAHVWPRHPWQRFVALGDSFTEGIGDPDPNAPGGHRGWADRVAEVLAQGTDDLAYANLAVRGKLIRQIRDEQVERALELKPDLITFSGGGNDVIRPKSDPDAVSAIVEETVAALSRNRATILLFTATDVGFSPVFRNIRGKVAIYNENLRAIADKYDCLVADQWSFAPIQDMRLWSPDRLHLNALGHHEVARLVLGSLNVPNELVPAQPEPLPLRSWRLARSEDISWAREYLVPWVVRRVRHQSSGDHVQPKRPDAGPY